MKGEVGYRRERLSFARKAVRASAASLRKKSVFHCMTEIDISRPRAFLRDYGQLCGNKPSFTAYIVKCFSNSIERFPGLNAFIIGNRILYLDDITISILVERGIGDEVVPEPLAIRSCQDKSYLKISDEIRAGQRQRAGALGSLSGLPWLSYLPGFLLGAFIAVASRSARIGLKSGKLAVSSVGMFSKEACWFLPHGAPTVLLTVGSIVRRPVETEGGIEVREHLCLTLSFDHDVVDGSPAARFVGDLSAEISGGVPISLLLEGAAGSRP